MTSPPSGRLRDLAQLRAPAGVHDAPAVAGRPEAHREQHRRGEHHERGGSRRSTRRVSVPASGSSTPKRMRMSVVVPAPFGPRSPATRPAGTSRSTGSRTTRSPKVLGDPSRRQCWFHRLRRDRRRPAGAVGASVCYPHWSAAGWSSLVARRAHNPKVEGSNPSPATIAELQVRGPFRSAGEGPLLFTSGATTWGTNPTVVCGPGRCLSRWLR
jgi:hypothetical protein